MLWLLGILEYGPPVHRQCVATIERTLYSIVDDSVKDRDRDVVGKVVLSGGHTARANGGRGDSLTEVTPVLAAKEPRHNCTAPDSFKYIPCRCPRLPHIHRTKLSHSHHSPELQLSYTSYDLIDHS